MTDDTIAYCILAVENEAKINYAMSVKDGLYEFMQFAKQVKEAVYEYVSGNTRVGDYQRKSYL